MASVTPAALESCSLTFFKFIFSKRVFRNEFLQLVTMSWWIGATDWPTLDCSAVKTKQIYIYVWYNNSKCYVFRLLLPVRFRNIGHDPFHISRRAAGHHVILTAWWAAGSCLSSWFYFCSSIRRAIRQAGRVWPRRVAAVSGDEQTISREEDTLTPILISKSCRHKHCPTIYLFADAGLFFRLLRVLCYKDSKQKKKRV